MSGGSTGVPQDGLARRPGRGPRAGQMRSGWPRNLGGLAVSMTGEPEGRRQSKVQACAERHPRKHRSEPRAGARGQLQEGRWIGYVELHSYGPDDGVNFQNIVEGGAVFERLIESASPPSGARSWNRLRPAAPTCRRHHVRDGRRASTGAGVGSPTTIREKSACS